jgi:molecular chaperone IbpA
MPLVSMLLDEDVEMRVLDVSPLSRSFIGFDHLFDPLQSSMGDCGDYETYPPYNVERMGEDSYRISLAVAGFRPEELSITSEPGVVTIGGKKSADQQGEYLY